MLQWNVRRPANVIFVRTLTISNLQAPYAVNGFTGAFAVGRVATGAHLQPLLLQEGKLAAAPPGTQSTRGQADCQPTQNHAQLIRHPVQEDAGRAAAAHLQPHRRGGTGQLRNRVAACQNLRQQSVDE